MSKCRVRLILWLVLVAASLVGGITLDLVQHARAFPPIVRLVGLIGIVGAHFPLKRTGRLLRLRGNAEEWGCTSRLITDEIYRCVRHPHHLAVGIFMTAGGLLIGRPWSLLLIAGIQWAWILAFLFLVEEPELRAKFGRAYADYSRETPLLIPNIRSVVQVLGTPLRDPGQERWEEDSA